MKRPIAITDLGILDGGVWWLRRLATRPIHRGHERNPPLLPIVISGASASRQTRRTVHSRLSAGTLATAHTGWLPRQSRTRLPAPEHSTVKLTVTNGSGHQGEQERVGRRQRVAHHDRSGAGARAPL